MNNEIREWESVNKIEALEEKYFEKSGIKPNNVSHWNSSNDFINKISSIYLQNEINTGTGEIYNYNFSYDIPQTQITKILKKLGYKSDRRNCLITPTGTISINCVLNWLKNKKGIKRLGIICPVYFTVIHCCDNLSLDYKKIYMKKDSYGEFHFPCIQIDQLIEHNSIDALYITNPVYCTSCYIDNTDMEYINNLLNRGITVIWDACLSINHHKVFERLADKSNFISIHEPHKSLAINGRKFSVICFPKEELNFFESRADIIYGGLSESNLMAVEHFLSDNYNQCIQFLLTEINNSYLIIKELSEKYKNVRIDPYSKSIYISCYFDNLDSSLAYKNDFLRMIIKETQCSFIPGNRNHFNSDLKFCFRINLTRCDETSTNMIDKIFKLLDNYK